MRIPRDFDRWMFDYKEGNLSHTENGYFENYMSENPQLNSDIEGWNNSYVRKQNIEYPGIASLHKESKVKFYFGWAATTFVIIASFFGSYNYLTESNANLYNLRQAKLNYQPTQTTTLPFVLNQIKKDSKRVINSQSQNLSNAQNTISTTITRTENLNSKNKVYTEKKSNSSKGYYSQNIKQIEINKIQNPLGLHSKNNSASYSNNPSFKESNSKGTKSNHKRNHSKSLLRTLKKGYKKIEKITGYPVGLINLKDPEFLTPTVSLFDINPGFVGGNGTTRFDSKYRNQWFGTENNLQSSTLNFDTYIKSIRGGIGVSLNSNNFNNGLLTDTKVNVIYSPKFAISRKLIFEPAVKLSLGIMTVDQTKINTDNVFEIERGKLLKTNHSNDILTANNLWYKDYGLGFVLNSEIFYFGFNADNLAKHKQSIYGENNESAISYTTILGMDYQSRNKNMIFSPFITYQSNSILNELWAGANFKYHWLTVGGGYSTKNDFSIALGIKTSNFKVSYQYDMTTSVLSPLKMGSHSIGLRINTKRKH